MITCPSEINPSVLRVLQAACNVSILPKTTEPSVQLELFSTTI